MNIFLALAVLLVSGLTLADEPDVQTQLKTHYFDAARRGATSCSVTTKRCRAPIC